MRYRLLHEMPSMGVLDWAQIMLQFVPRCACSPPAILFSQMLIKLNIRHSSATHSTQCRT